MSEKSVLMIGGPWDGRVYPLDPDRTRYVNVPRPMPLRIGNLEEPGALLPLMETDTYDVRAWGFHGIGQTEPLWIAHRIEDYSRMSSDRSILLDLVRPTVANLINNPGLVLPFESRWR